MHYKIITITCALAIFFSCTKEQVTANMAQYTTKEIDMLNIDSKETVKKLVNQEESLTSLTKSFTGNKIQNLLTEMNFIDYINDPVISVELRSLGISKPPTNINIYELLGYDNLVPNLNFAKLLNIRGEIMVRDTIYKISPAGTFYFHKSLLDYFENNYSNISALEDFEKLTDRTYKREVNINKQVSSICLYDTYAYDDKEDLIPDFHMEEIETKISPIPPKNEIIDNNWEEAQDIDWDSQPSYNTGANTVVGKWLEGAFGRNKKYTSNFDSKHRIWAKLYYYDYVIYSEIGAKTKMQKKKVAWNKTKAEKLYLIWNSMVIKTDFPNTVNYPQVGGNQPNRYFLGKRIEKVPGTNKEGLVAYYGGSALTDAELKKFAEADYVNNVIDLKIHVNEDLSKDRICAAKYITNKCMYTVIYPYGKMGKNAEILQSTFDSDLHMIIGLKTPTSHLPKGWENWIKHVSGQKPKAPELIQGEIRVAAKHNGSIKGLRLIKQK